MNHETGRELARDNPGSALDIIRDEGIVPAFDLETLELFDGRFEEFIGLMTEKGCTPRIIESAHNLRDRFITERANVWRPLSELQRFAHLEDDPEVSQEIYAEQTSGLNKALDKKLHGTRAEWWSGIVYSSEDALERWFMDNGLHDTSGADPRKQALRTRIAQDFEQWSGQQRQAVFQKYRHMILAEPIIDFKIDIPKVIERIQRFYIAEYLRDFDQALSSALDEGIAQAKDMPQAEATPEQAERSRLRKLGSFFRSISETPQVGHQTDETGLSFKMLGGFFSLSRKLTELNEEAKTNSQFKHAALRDFDSTSGHGKFKARCMAVINEARRELEDLTNAERLEEFLEQYEHLVGQFGSQEYTHARQEPRSNYGQQDWQGFEEKARKQYDAFTETVSTNATSVRTTTNSLRDTIHVLPSKDAEEATSPAVLSRIITPFMVSANKFWKSELDQNILETTIKSLLSQAVTDPSKFQPAKVFRKLAAKYHPDRGQTAAEKDMLTEQFRAFEFIWDKFNNHLFTLELIDNGLELCISDTDFVR